MIQHDAGADQSADQTRLLDALDRTRPAWSAITRAAAARLLYLGSEPEEGDR